MCAHRHACSDFTRPLGHAHQHDVHNTDTTDDERNASDRPEQNRHDRGCRRSCVSDLLLIAHGKIIVAAGPDVMALP